MKKNIFIPIEVKHREFFSNLMLAYYAVKSKFRVYIGTKSSINKLLKIKKKKGGIFLFKGGMDLESTIEIKKKCNYFAILDQELGTVKKNFKKVARRRIWPGTEKYIDRYYVIGNYGYNASLKVFPKMKESIHCTGWPRVDLWRKENNYLFEEKSNEILEKYGNFILFSSDFGYNSVRFIKERLNIEKKSKWKLLLKEFDNRKKNAYARFKEYKSFLKILKSYDKIKNCPKIIVRPHPNDDVEAWFNFSKKVSNIKVIYEGEISPWIIASSGLIHRGCTSAIQAYMQQLPVAYYIINKSNIKFETPYDISEKIFTVEQLVKFCRFSLNKGKSLKQTKYKSKFNKMVYINDKKFSSELIIDDFLKLNLKPEPEIKINIKDRLIVLSTLILSSLKVKIKNTISSRKTKMPNGILQDEVKEFFNKININEQIKIKKIFKDCIKIEYDI